jgi:hypothetical protein
MPLLSKKVGVGPVHISILVLLIILAAAWFFFLRK